MTQGNGLHMRAQEAIYHTPNVRNYRGNPFIEALPQRLERVDARALMRVMPKYHDEDRDLPAIDREHLASLVASVRKDTWLHGELYSRVSRLMCNGYMSRNPVDPGFQRLVDARVGVVAGTAGAGVAAPPARMNGGYVLKPGLAPDSNGLIFLGTSGIGKSKAVEMVLGLWPQLILHREYAGRPFSTVQLPWIKLDAPSDGSVLALAERFYNDIDNLHLIAGLASNFRTTYMKARTKEATIAPDMARVAAQIGLGLLVLDEVQDLSPAKSRRFLSFLVQLVNVVGIPILLVGGLDAFHLVTEQFRQIRRGSTEGDLIVTQSERGSRWDDFCRDLWTYQYTTEKVEFTPDHAAALFDVSQGITELVVIAHKTAQVRAISTNRPFVTPAIIRSVRDLLNLAQPALGAMRRGSAFVIDRMSDLKVPTNVESLPFLRADEPVAKRAVERKGAAAAKSPATEMTPDTTSAPPGEDAEQEQRREDASRPAAATPISDDTAAEHAGEAGRDDIRQEQGESDPRDAGSSASVDDPAASPRGDVSPAVTGPAAGPTLLQAVRDGLEDGTGPRETLAAMGCGAGELFQKVAQITF